MNDISLHILDIAENSIIAGARNIDIKVTESTKKDMLSVEIKDDGKGISRNMINKISNPFVTSRKTRKVGLGIPLLKEAAEAAGGDVIVLSDEGKGTKIKAVFRHSHIDRKPLGDIAETLAALVLMSDTADFTYRHEKNGTVFEFGTRELKEQLGAESLKNATIINNLKKIIKQKLSELN